MRVTGEFSYRAETIGGDGFCLAGDAFAFLDPVFSTGLFMALKSGEMAADAVHGGLSAGGVTAAAFEQYDRDMRWALDQFRQLVLSFYNERFSFREFIRAHPDLHLRLVDALVGNVFADLGPLFAALREFSGAGLGITTWGCAPNPRQALAGTPLPRAAPAGPRCALRVVVRLRHQHEFGIRLDPQFRGVLAELLDVVRHPHAD